MYALPRSLAALLCVVALLPSTAQAQAAKPSRSGEFDGHWAVQVVCEDVKGASGLVKGYSLQVPVEIREGALTGKYSEVASPATLVLTGSVFTGGEIRLEAKGTTGSPEYSVGKVAPGKPYSYTMTGRLAVAKGEATRSELRPCKAFFSKK